MTTIAARFRGRRLPRSDADGAIAHLLATLRHDMSIVEIAETVEPDVASATYFHTGQPVERAALLDWRSELVEWARADWGYPEPLRSDDERRAWNVALGLRLAEDLSDVAERHHPQVHAWLASQLLPDFIAMRWGLPNAVTDHESENPRLPTGTRSWRRFTTDSRNGLRLAIWRVTALGEHIARDALEDEFQAVLERPTVGADPRVASIVLQEFIDHADRRGGGPDRGSLVKAAMIRLRQTNSLRPLRFHADDVVRQHTRTAIVAVIDESA